jgi:hypothetical protein
VQAPLRRPGFGRVVEVEAQAAFAHQAAKSCGPVKTDPGLLNSPPGSGVIEQGKRGIEYALREALLCPELSANLCIFCQKARAIIVNYREVCVFSCKNPE